MDRERHIVFNNRAIEECQKTRHMLCDIIDRVNTLLSFKDEEYVMQHIRALRCLMPDVHRVLDWFPFLRAIPVRQSPLPLPAMPAFDEFTRVVANAINLPEDEPLCQPEKNPSAVVLEISETPIPVEPILIPVEPIPIPAELASNTTASERLTQPCSGAMGPPRQSRKHRRRTPRSWAFVNIGAHASGLA